MRIDEILRIEGILSIVGAAGLLVWWFLMPVFLPVAAAIYPALLQVKGALVSGDTRVVAGLISSGVFLGIGYILFGISAIQTKSYPKIPIWFLIVGAPVFGNGIAFPIRTVGLLVFCIGTIWLSIWILKDKKIAIHKA